MESVSLIDVSSEGDLLIPDLRSPGLEVNHGNHNDGSEAFGAWVLGNPVKMSSLLEQVPEPSESPEQKQPKSGKINMRKSLAWDSAFFTSEGILDTEELAVVNSTFRKAEACRLPGIEEELRKSTESTSTLDSDSYALENLEVDLFGNLRASIQRSFVDCEKASSGKPDASCLGSRKKVEAPSKKKVQMKPPIALKKAGLSNKQPECTSKEATAGVKAAAKRTGDSNSSLKLPRIVSKPTLVPRAPSTKASSGSLQMKINNRTTSSGNGNKGHPTAAFSKTDGVSCSMTSRSIPSPKPTPGSQRGTVVFSATRSSYNSPVSTLSPSAGKSSLEPTRKRSAPRNGDHSSSGPTTKSPLKTTKSRLASSNSSHLPRTARSTLKLPSRASPTSSFDSVLSGSSSSTSTTIKPRYSVESFDACSTSSSSSMAVPSDVDIPQSSDMHFSTDPPGARKEISGMLSQSQHVAKDPLGSRMISEPPKRDPSKSTNTNNGTKCFKPSGLRMPSPKIGYFDAEKALVRGSNKFSQTGVSDSNGANKLKPSKIPSIRPAAKHAATNFDLSRTQSAPLSPTDSMNLSMPMNQISKPAELKDSSISSEDNHFVVFKGAEVANMVHPKSTGAIRTGNGSPLSGEESSDVACKTAHSTYQIGKEEKHEQLACGLNSEGSHGETDLHSVTKNVEKENLIPASGNNGLGRHSPTGSQDMLTIEIMRKKVSSLSLSEPGDFISS